jgi:hypothetical protein
VRDVWQKINEAWHSCHWWPDLDGRRISAMTAIVILIALLAIVALSASLGADSRGLNDDAWRRDDLWSRDPAPHRHA